MVTPGGLSHVGGDDQLRRAAAGSATARGYRYDAIDPESGRPWPAMPAAFRGLAARAAAAAGFAGFAPDACLINRYEPGARLIAAPGPRRTRLRAADRLGVARPAGDVPVRRREAQRADACACRCAHGDVVVWGGPARLSFHGVLPLKAGHHPFAGTHRINLTLRRAT